MWSSCPQPGGLPLGRALQPGEVVGKGPAAPPGSICGSQAIAEPAGLLPLLRAAVHPGVASSAALARPRRRRRRPHRRPGTRKVGGNAAPPRLSLPAPPLAPRPPPAARAALPGPAPGPGRPRAVTPPGGAARRARLGAKREAGSRGRVGAELGAAFHQPGFLPGCREAPPRSPSTCAAPRPAGTSWARIGCSRPGPLSEPPSPYRESPGHV